MVVNQYKTMNPSNFSIYQCIPAYKPIPTTRIIKSITTKCKVLLDIEDGIQDVQTPSLTPHLKKTARNDFETIIKNIANQKVSLRINPIRSSEFKYDKILLHKYSGNIESVFLPKIETSNDLKIFKKEFGNKFKLNIIIETQKGINNLDEILHSEIADNIDFVFFGNYDYYLDKKIYPVREQYSMEYWKIVKQIIYKSEKYNIGFGNSPYTNIEDKKTIKFSIKQLSKLCNLKYAVMSLHKEQTYYYYNLLTDLNYKEQTKISKKPDNITILDFNSHRQKSRGFSFFNNRIITPQEYLLMKLRENGKI